MGKLTKCLENHLTKKPKIEQGVCIARVAAVLFGGGLMDYCFGLLIGDVRVGKCPVVDGQ